MEGIELLVSRIERRNQPEANIFSLYFPLSLVMLEYSRSLFSSLKQEKKVIIIRVKQTAFRVQYCAKNILKFLYKTVFLCSVVCVCAFRNKKFSQNAFTPPKLRTQNSIQTRTLFALKPTNNRIILMIPSTLL